jgi:hypothetical protein
MSNRTMKHGLVVAVAGTIVLGAVTPSWSAPVLSSTAAVKAAAPSAVIDVRNRNRGQYGNNGANRNNGAFRNNGAGAGVALGVLGAAGALAAGSAYRQNLYGPGYYQQGYGGGYGYGYGGYANGPANYGYYNSPNYGYYNNH